MQPKQSNPSPPLNPESNWVGLQAWLAANPDVAKREIEDMLERELAGKRRSIIIMRLVARMKKIYEAELYQRYGI